MSHDNIHAASVRIARAVHRGDKLEEANARRDLAELKLAAAVERALEKAPPLTPAQIKRLSGLLRSGGQR